MCKDCMYLHNFILCAAEDAINLSRTLPRILHANYRDVYDFCFNFYLATQLLLSLEIILNKLRKKSELNIFRYSFSPPFAALHARVLSVLFVDNIFN